jgi:hypothetical protein
MQMSPLENLTLSERQEAALGILNDVVEDLKASREETARWKARHRALTNSTLLIIAALMLVITALAISVVNLLPEGCR